LSCADTRPLLLLAQVGLARRDAVDGEGEAARRHERLGAVVDETGVDQPAGHELAQIRRRLRLHAGRNFLGEKFEQQVGHGGLYHLTGRRWTFMARRNPLTSICTHNNCRQRSDRRNHDIMKSRTVTSMQEAIENIYHYQRAIQESREIQARVARVWSWY